MSILIFVRVLENSSQRAYFRSCDEKTATPLADKSEIEDLWVSLCPIERFDLYDDEEFSVSQAKLICIFKKGASRNLQHSSKTTPGTAFY